MLNVAMRITLFALPPSTIKTSLQGRPRNYLQLISQTMFLRFKQLNHFGLQVKFIN